MDSSEEIVLIELASILFKLLFRNLKFISIFYVDKDKKIQSAMAKCEQRVFPMTN